VLLFSSFAYALNLELQIIPIKTAFTDEENILLDVNIVSYELFSNTENTRLIVKVRDQNIIQDVGLVKPDEIKRMQINLNKFSAGNYAAEAFLEYDFLGVTDQTQTEYFNIKVEPSTPIVMKTYNTMIKDIIVPNSTEINKEFEIKVKIFNKLDEVQVEFLVGEEKSTQTITETGDIEVSKKIKTVKEGILPLEIRLISKGIVQHSKIINLVIANPQNYMPVEPVKLEIKKGEVIIEVGNEPENIIDEIGCFVVGGCKGDLSGPDIKNVLIQESSNETYFELIADDAQTGNSSIENCQINIGSQWENMQAKDGTYDAPLETTSYSLAKIIYEDQQIMFRCSDSLQNTTTITTEVVGKEKGTIKITVLDKALNKRIKDALIYFDGELKGATNSNGEITISTYAKEYNLKISTKGYINAEKAVAVQENKETSVAVDLEQALEQRFEVPAGFEKYVNAKMASHTAIHPQEKRLMSYSFPIKSTRKVDVAKDLIEKVDEYLTYDYSCLQDPKPATCQAWHDSEYDVIETGKGVCYDWATLGISFTDSYGIPARYVRGCWTYNTLNGKKETVCHAWEEVYLPEEGGWMHLDTLWNQYNNPCVYASQMSVICASNFDAFDPNETDWQKMWTSLDEKYVCGKPCDLTTTLSEEEGTKIFAEGFGFDYIFELHLDNTRVNVTFGRKLTSEEEATIKENIAEGKLNEGELKEALLSIVRPQFETMGRIENVTLEEINVQEPKEIEIRFSVEFEKPIDEFKHSFTISQYSSVDYSLDTTQPVFSIEPIPMNREGIKYHWRFAEAGEHTINVTLKEEKIVFILTENPLLSSVIENVVKKLNKAEIILLANESTALDQIEDGNFSKVYLLGSYSEISDSFEKKILEKGIEVVRFIGSTSEVSSDIASLFWLNSEEAVIGSAYDFESVKLAKNKAIAATLPLILLEESFDEKTKTVLENMGTNKIYLADPNQKISDSVKEQIKTVAGIEEIVLEREPKDLKLVSGKKTSPIDYSNIIIFLVILLVVILGVAYLYKKKQKRQY